MADTPHTKICTGCKQDLPRTAYSKLKKDGRYIRARCKPCRAKESADTRASKLYSKYGMTIADYDRMFAEQDGRCALCKSVDPKSRWNRLHVDHCHETGRVRGLLCNSCNVALGRLGDTKAALLKAYHYVVGGPANAR